MTELICIVCPKGCHLTVDEAHDYAVQGNSCPRGEAYGRKELTDPRRVLTSTVRLEGASLRRLPVKTDGEIPKADLFRAMELLNGITVQAPIQRGDRILSDILGTGVNVIATKSVP